MTPLLISAATIKKYGIIESNADVKLIDATILFAQDQQLQMILGTKLYKELCTQVDASTLTALNLTLINDYIEPFLCNAVIAEGCISFNYRMSNKAIVTMDSNFQHPVSSRELELVQAKWQGRADFYGKRLSEYLCQERLQYPLYDTATDSSDIKGRDVGYNSGFNLNTTRRNYDTTGKKFNN